MEPIGIRDFLNYRYLSNVQYAPDGKRAAFVVSNCNEEDNGYESRLWLYDGTLRQLTDLGREASYVWETAYTILFPAVRTADEKKRAEKKETFTSYYRLDLCGGEAIRAFTLPLSVHRLIPIREGVFVALADIDVNEPDAYRMNDEERAELLKKQEAETDYEVFDELPYWFNGAGIVNKHRTALFLVKTDPMDIQRVTEPLFSVDSLTVIGDTVYYAGSAYAAKSPVAESALYCLNTQTGENTLLKAYHAFSVMLLKAVGERLIMVASDNRSYGLNQNGDFYSVDRTTGDLTLLKKNDEGLWNSVGSDVRHGEGESFKSANGMLYYVSTRLDSANLYALDANGTEHTVAGERGSVDDYAVCDANDTALLIALYEGRLQELYEKDLRTGALRQISHFNDDALKDRYVAECEPLSIESCGLSIDGWVLKPKDYDPAKKYPAVFDIHGGPKTVYGTVFYHETQVWAGMGYFVFFCNPKGSDGKGDDFADIRGHYGDTDYQNLMDFADAVLKAYPAIDPNRVCETGGSYGGFMTNWIIGHTDRFCCAASQRSISNWLSFYGISDIGFYFANDQNDADFYENPERLWAHSPLKYAQNVTTPTLFIHSDEDYRCPVDQGLQMYAALVDRGVPARLCLFHGENHELSRSGKPKHRIRRLTEITNWFEKYTKA